MTEQSESEDKLLEAAGQYVAAWNTIGKSSGVSVWEEIESGFESKLGPGAMKYLRELENKALETDRLRQIDNQDREAKIRAEERRKTAKTKR